MLSFYLQRKPFSTIPAQLKSGLYQLQRGVIRVSGQDTVKYLNGLCTANLPNWMESESLGRFAAFLNAQVRR